MRRIRFASIRSIAAGAALAASATVVEAQICTPFTDVASGDGFCGSIQWMYNRGITLGCAENQYCPAQFVRRDQMAAFMFRLGNVVHQQGGNAFGATAVLGTTDAHAIDVRVANERVMRFEPHAISPNVIGGSQHNSVEAGVRGATIAGGGVAANVPDPFTLPEAPNRVTDDYGTIGGGFANVAGNDAGSLRPWATVGGGARNVASGRSSTIGGGYNNRADGETSTVAGGFLNTAVGSYSSSPGGARNDALGDFSFAAGYRAKAVSDGCFVWADSVESNFVCGTPNAFIVRATGGVVIRSAVAPEAGVILGAGSSTWAMGSDRDAKDNVVPVDPRGVLDRLVDVPIATWNYSAQPPQVRHMGPMAQDLHAAFGLGESDRHITSIDADGIALAAIQGLNSKLEQRDAALRDAQRAADREIAALKREIAALHRAVEVLTARTTAEGRVAHTR